MPAELAGAASTLGSGGAFGSFGIEPGFEKRCGGDDFDAAVAAVADASAAGVAVGAEEILFELGNGGGCPEPGAGGGFDGAISDRMTVAASESASTSISASTSGGI